jgi:hypothetical protein
VDSQFVEEDSENSSDDGSGGKSSRGHDKMDISKLLVSTADSGDGPGTAYSIDGRDDANGAQMDLAVSGTGSMKRASKESAIEKTTKNSTRQRLLRWPRKSTKPSQPKPKMVVDMETGGKNLLFLQME